MIAPPTETREMSTETRTVEQTIWEFHLDVAAIQYVMVPRGARFLSVQEQNGRVMAWALVDPSAPAESWMVRIVGTGNPIESRALDDMRYLGTVQLYGYVWHVFIPEAAHV